MLMASCSSWSERRASSALPPLTPFLFLMRPPLTLLPCSCFLARSECAMELPSCRRCSTLSSKAGWMGSSRSCPRRTSLRVRRRERRERPRAQRERCGRISPLSFRSSNPDWLSLRRTFCTRLNRRARPDRPRRARSEGSRSSTALCTTRHPCSILSLTETLDRPLQTGRRRRHEIRERTAPSRQRRRLLSHHPEHDVPHPPITSSADPVRLSGQPSR